MTREKKSKKTYEKPKVTRINLDARCAVLGFCKAVSAPGPLQAACTTPTQCNDYGS